MSLVWYYSWVFLFSPFKSFGFINYPHISSSPWILLNKIPIFQFSEFWLPTSSWSLWYVHCQVPCHESLQETKISDPQKLFLVPLFKVCYIYKPFPHQPVLVSTIKSAHMLLICNNFLGEFQIPEIVFALFLKKKDEFLSRTISTLFD